MVTSAGRRRASGVRACTLLNAADARRCKVCDARGGMLPAAAQLAAQPQAGGGDASSQRGGAGHNKSGKKKAGNVGLQPFCIERP